MKFFTKIIVGLTMGGLILPAVALADALLELQIDQEGPPARQIVAIKEGRIMAKGIGGDHDLDFLYEQALDRVMVIDHRKRTVMVVDEEQVASLGQQAQNIQPLLQGLSERVAQLSPEERRKWQEMLGDTLSLEEIAQATAPPEPHRLVAAGEDKVAGIPCQKKWVMQKTTPLAELCLAEAAALPLPTEDGTTLRGLFGLYDRLAAKGRKLSRQLGLSLPTLGGPEAQGVPIRVHDLSRDVKTSVTLQQVRTAAVPSEMMIVPAGYRTTPLSLLP